MTREFAAVLDSSVRGQWTAHGSMASCAEDEATSGRRRARSPVGAFGSLVIQCLLRNGSDPWVAGMEMSNHLREPGPPAAIQQRQGGG